MLSKRRKRKRDVLFSEKSREAQKRNHIREQGGKGEGNPHSPSGERRGKEILNNSYQTEKKKLRVPIKKEGKRRKGGFFSSFNERKGGGGGVSFFSILTPKEGGLGIYSRRGEEESFLLIG